MMSLAWRQALRWASPGEAGGRLSILIYHRVLPTIDPLFPEEVDAQRFEAQCRWVRSLFNVLPLAQAVTRLRERTLPERALSITFDDGYADNHDVALPILRRYGLKATFFIATGFLDGGRMWNDSLIEAVRRTPLSRLDLRDVLADPDACHAVGDWRQRRQVVDRLIAQVKYLDEPRRAETVAALVGRAQVSLPNDLMLSTGKLLGMRRAGMDIGAHTVSHPILSRIDETTARQEIVDSRLRLETILDEPVRLFAYPNGKPGVDYIARDADLAQDCGFDAACSTAWGAADAGTSHFELPRFTPWDRGEGRFAWRMVRNLRRASVLATSHNRVRETGR